MDARATSTPASGPILVVATSGALAVTWERLAASPALGSRLAGAVVVGPESERRRTDVPILGDLATLEAVARQIRPAIIALGIPGAMSALLADVRGRLRGTGAELRSIPTIEDLVLGPPERGPGEPWSADLRCLTGRAPRPIDEALLRGAISGRRVLITGAGGSIGSELARLCARLDPAALLLVERSENALFEIDRHLAAAHPAPERRAILHDVVDAERTRRRMEALRPEIVFHAAAHKHVPLMEDHPAAAVQNNVLGTCAVVDAALATGVERVVFVSTDKAVRPSSVMGATKLVAERYVRARNRSTDARLCVVRFGNVLGSACSVLPIWTRQLAEGGPLTVTDARMTRYFMTIPEAAALVAQAGAIEPATVGGADVFVLDMGEPVRILELARRFARAHGLEPVLDGGASDGRGAATVEIALTGRRAGEKLHEDLVHDPAALAATAVPGVNASGEAAPDPAAAIADVEALAAALAHDDAEGLVARLWEIAGDRAAPADPADTEHHAHTEAEACIASADAA